MKGLKNKNNFFHFVLFKLPYPGRGFNLTVTGWSLSSNDPLFFIGGLMLTKIFLTHFSFVGGKQVLIETVGRNFPKTSKRNRRLEKEPLPFKKWF